VRLWFSPASEVPIYRQFAILSGDLKPSDRLPSTREPLHRTRECAFGVRALESEPVDPRL
jgi:hypothetical protein